MLGMPPNSTTTFEDEMTYKNYSISLDLEVHGALNREVSFYMKILTREVSLYL